MTTVGKYLAKRLEQAGLRHIFGVPGDYVLSFFDCLEESGMKVVTTCNELNAGYAADAYARLNGVGGVCVTYGVGGFSLFNAVVGAFAERLPLIVVSGGPRIYERDYHHLLHHTIGDMNLQYDIYEKITEASVILMSPEEAPQRIDDTISACLRSKRPVYVEIPQDLVSKPCSDPGPFNVDTVIPSDKGALEEAVTEASEMLKSAARPLILAGVEPHRFGIRGELRALVDHTGYPFATTLLGKTVIPEKHPQFVGVYGGSASWDDARRVAAEADIVLSLGALMTDIHLGKRTTFFETDKMIAANSDSVKIKHHVYDQVSLKDFIGGLHKALPSGSARELQIRHPSEALCKDFDVTSDRKITVKRFYQRINHFIRDDHTIVAETGDALFSAANLFLPEKTQFIDQAFYLSIGYSIPATLGVQLAGPDRRPVTFVGDGAFQMTVQELSTIIREGLNPVIFLMNNDGYTVERVIHDGPYNDIKMWKYHMIPKIFGGGWGAVVETEGELEESIQRAEKEKDKLAFIEVKLDKWDCSENLKNLAKALK